MFIFSPESCVWCSLPNSLAHAILTSIPYVLHAPKKKKGKIYMLFLLNYLSYLSMVTTPETTTALKLLLFLCSLMFLLTYNQRTLTPKNLQETAGKDTKPILIADINHNFLIKALPGSKEKYMLVKQ